MKALTLWQPWASLVAIGAKTIETRSWSTSYRGPLAIHAAARRPELMWLPPIRRDDYGQGRWLVIDTITDPAYQGPQPQGRRIPKRAQTPTLFFPNVGPHGRPHVEGTRATEQGTAIYLPLGAVVATVRLIDVLPMATVADGIRRDLGRFISVLGNSLVIYDDGEQTDISDQRPLGDFTPGRFGWIYEDVQALPEPIPAAGRQGLWEWAPDTAGAATA